MKRIIILFLVKQLLLFGVLYLTLNLYSNFSPNNLLYKVDTTKVDTIRIVSGNTADHSLVLVPPGKVDVLPEQKVTWILSNNPNNNVKSFRIWIKNNSPLGFKWHNSPSSLIRAEKKTARTKHVEPGDSIIYEYSIIWKDKMGGKPHPFDPKIAIKPSIDFKGYDFLEWPFYAVYAFLAVVITLLDIRKIISTGPGA